jgi:hypothetical protein
MGREKSKKLSAALFCLPALPLHYQPISIFLFLYGLNSPLLAAVLTHLSLRVSPLLQERGSMG